MEPDTFQDTDSAGSADTPDTVFLYASDEYRARRHDPTGFLDFLRRFRNVRNGPFACDPDDLPGSITPMAIGCLEDFPKPLPKDYERTLWERSYAPGAVGRLFEAQAKNFIDAAEKRLGTHTAKIPSVNVAGPGGLFSDLSVGAEARHLPFASSMSTNSRLVFGGAGSAASARAQRLLALRLRVGDEVVDVTLDIARRGPIYAAFLELGCDASMLEMVSDILARRLQGDEDRTPGDYAKFLLWPSSSGDVAITPVHPYAMHVEIGERIRERRRKDRSIPTIDVQVAGGKPQNAGVVNSDLNGRHLHIEAFPPSTGSNDLRFLIAQSRADGRVLYGRAGSGHPMIKALGRITSDDRNNDGIRMSLDRVIGALVRIVIQPLLRIRDTIEEGQRFAAAAVSTLPSSYSRLLRHGASGLTGSELSEVVSDIVSEVSALPHRVGFDDAMRRRVAIVAERIVVDSFGGVLRND